MKSSKNAFKTLRIFLLLSVGFGAGYLLILNRQHDPRFYRFLGSAPGQLLSKVFNWSGEETVLLNIPEADFTSDEQAVKRQLEAQLAKNVAADIIKKTNGQEIRGQVISETANTVTIQQQFGDSGGMKFSLKRGDILSIERAVQEPTPEITYRDVRFKMEFPEMNLYRRPPYTIVTSEKFFDVEDAVRTLEYLHGDFETLFDPLIERAEGKSIQLLFFSSEEGFDTYRRKHAPNLGYSAGFFSPALDRFVIYDQKESAQMREAEERLQQMYADYRKQHTARHDQASIQNWYAEQKRNLSRMAGQETTRVLRHEGAHQLFYTYGIHSPHHAENLWVIEGLAVYCETDPVGRVVEMSKSVLLTAAVNDRLVKMEDLVNYRSPQGFGRLVRDGEIDIAYAQSWGLVHYFMQPERRNDFFNYINYVRDSDNTTAVAKGDRFALLCQAMGEDPGSLMDQVLAHVEAL